MRYLPPFQLLKSLMTLENVKGELVAHCSYEVFIKLLKSMLQGIDVDEAWYLERYPDIAEAIRQGLVESPRRHFLNDGYFEGRWPYRMEVDEVYYLENNPGVAEYIRRGLLKSGQQHFDENGYQEGRLPFGM